MAIGPQQNISLHSGDTRTLRVTVNDENGAALDITDASFLWAMSKKVADSVAPKGTAILTKSSATVGAVDTWVLGATYSPNDEVTYNGETYREQGFDGGVATTPPVGGDQGGAPEIDGDIVWVWLETATSSPGPIVLITPAAGLIEVYVYPADTAALAGEFYHELQMTLDGAISTVLYGQATIVKDLIQ